ncbi:MAG: hypothetical protein AAF211_26930, partial [Myxococcota bacterium]
DQAMVERLVRATSGVPLAIELAAARLRLLDLDTLVSDLERDVAALGRRQGSVEAMLHATWSTLGPAEQDLVALLGWLARPADVETLCEASALDRWSLLDALDSVVRGSLAADRERRFSVLGVVSRFAAPRGSETASRAFVTWAAGRARTLTEQRTQSPEAATRSLTEEAPTLRRALDLATEPEERATLAIAIGGYDVLWKREGHLRKVLAELDLDTLPRTLAIDVAHMRTLLAPHGAGPDQQVALARQGLDLALADGTPTQRAAGWSRWVFARMVAEGARAARGDLETMLEAATAQGVPGSLTRPALLVGSDLAVRLGELEHALELVDRASVESSALMAPQLLARRAALQLLLGRDDLGVEAATKALAGARVLRMPMLVLISGHELLLCARSAGRLDLVEIHLPELEELARELDPSKMATLLLARASLEEDAKAQTTLEEAVALARRAGRSRVESLAQRALGFRRHQAAGVTAAIEHYRAAIEAVDGTDWVRERAIATAWHAMACRERDGRDGRSDWSRELSELVPTGDLAGRVVRLARAMLLEREPVPPIPDHVQVLVRTRQIAERALAVR